MHRNLIGMQGEIETKANLSHGVHIGSDLGNTTTQVPLQSNVGTLCNIWQ